MGLLLFENIKLFFIKPKQLFLILKNSPDLKSASILLLIGVSFLLLPNIKLFVSKTNTTIGIGSIVIASILSTIFMIGIALAALLCGSFFILLFCRIFGSKPKFTAILSAVIYCSSIPGIIFNIFYTLLPIKTDLSNIISINSAHPFLKEAIQSIEIFRLWIAAMEVVAISIISEITYFRSFIIVFSLWIIGLIWIYFFDLKMAI
ncbi:MAG: YIP1 family protein [Candidatus Firestonebacteria bacterium]